METKSCYYDAFISYRHNERDKKIVDTIQKLVENFRSPCDGTYIKKGERIKRVFTDRSELPMSADLGGAIRDALNKSRFLVVVASPEYIQSRWCMEELKTFLEYNNNSTENILFIQANGEPSCITDILSAAGINVESEAFCEPLYIDARSSSIKGSVKIIKKEYLRLAAVLIGCGYDALYQRHKRKVVSKILVSAVALLLLVATFATIFILQEKDITEEQEQREQVEDYREIDKAINEVYTLLDDEQKVKALYAMKALYEQYEQEGKYAEYLYEKLESAVVKAGYVPSFTAFAGELTPFDNCAMSVSSDGESVALFDVSTLRSDGELHLFLYDAYLTKTSEHTLILDEFLEEVESGSVLYDLPDIDYIESEDKFRIEICEFFGEKKWMLEYSADGERLSKEEIEEEKSLPATEKLYQAAATSPDYPICKSYDNVYILLTKGEGLFTPYGEKDEEYKVIRMPANGDMETVTTLKRTSEMHALDSLSLTPDDRFLLVKETRGVYNDVLTVCGSDGQFEGVRIDLGDYTIEDMQYSFDIESEVASFLFKLHVVGEDDKSAVACISVKEGELLGSEMYENSEFVSDCILSSEGYIYILSDNKVKALSCENMCLPERMMTVETEISADTDLSHNNLITEPDAFFYNSTAGMENRTTGNVTIRSDIARMHHITPSTYSGNDIGVGIDCKDEEILRFYSFEFKHAFYNESESVFGLIDYSSPENSELFRLYDLYSLMELMQ